MKMVENQTYPFEFDSSCFFFPLSLTPHLNICTYSRLWFERKGSYTNRFPFSFDKPKRFTCFPRRLNYSKFSGLLTGLCEDPAPCCWFGTANSPPVARERLFCIKALVCRWRLGSSESASS